MDEGSLVHSFLDTYDDAGAYRRQPGSRVGNRPDNCADVGRHRHLRLDCRPHLPLRHPDVRAKTRPRSIGTTGTHEIEIKGRAKGQGRANPRGWPVPAPLLFLYTCHILRTNCNLSGTFSTLHYLISRFSMQVYGTRSLKNCFLL